MNDFLTQLSDGEFDDELTSRIKRVQEAWDALQASFGSHLQRASAPLASIPLGTDALWQEMESSEASLEEGWRELARRKDRRLGR